MILDSSAIALILLTEKGDALEHLEGKDTLDLARYEIGNVIWKETALLGNIPPSEAITMVGYAARILGQMNLLGIETPGEASDTMRLAIEHGLTFYDAGYLHHAVADQPLVTEDDGLRRKAEEAGVEVITVAQLLEDK